MLDDHAPEPILPESWSVKEVVADLKADLKAGQTALKADIVEHLDKQDITLGEISTKVDSKADKADLLVLTSKIEGHGTRITTLEQHRLDQLAAKQFHNRMWAVVGTIGGILAVLAGSLIAAFVH